MFNLHYLKVLSLEMNCAFTYGIQFGTSTLNGFHVMYSQEFSDCEVPMPEPISASHYFGRRLPTVIDGVLMKLNSNRSMFDGLCQDANSVIDCRLILHVVTVSVFLKLLGTPKNQDLQHDLVRILLIHGVLLTELPLKYRAFSMNDSSNLFANSATRHLIKENLGKLQFIMAKVLDIFLQASEDEDPLGSMSGICDAWDGRLFYQILILLLESRRNGSELPLSDSAKRKFESLVDVVSSLLDGEKKLEAFPILWHCGDNKNFLCNSPQVMSADLKNRKAKIVAKYSPKKKQKKKQSGKQVDLKGTNGLIQMECSLLNEYAGKILENTSVKKLDIKDPDVAALVMSGNNFDETYHWHSGKPLSDEYDRTKDTNSDSKDKRALMNNQKYARFMQRYGQSLQDQANYKPIVVEKAKKSHQKEKNKVSKKSLEIQTENSMRLENMKLKKEEESWLNEKKRVKEYEDAGKYNVAVDIVNRSLLGAMEGEIKNAKLLKKARLLWKKWREYCKKNQDDRDETDVKMLFLTIQELVESSKEALTKKDKDSLAKYLDGLGFNDIVLKTNLTEKSFKFHGEYKLEISSSRFQLHNIGDKLKRDTRTDPDSRVEHFIPETWQRELLDAVDNKQSALIVAPTSSGKTFASYYCMERVLKEDNEGVVVYVSPTKALVNQVAATCCARYDFSVVQIRIHERK
jgi:hypothetical protein